MFKHNALYRAEAVAGPGAHLAQKLGSMDPPKLELDPGSVPFLRMEASADRWLGPDPCSSPGNCGIKKILSSLLYL